jgi:hypothetical protein
MITLERYKGPSTRHVCPGCGHMRVFSRYIVVETGDYIAEDLGRCDRESKCGYHKTPTAENFRNGRFDALHTRKPRGSVLAKSLGREPSPDYIGKQHLIDTLGGYEANAFVQGLLDLFPYDHQEIWADLGEYFVGTFPDPSGAYTCFAYIDQDMQFCKGKLIRFDRETLRRRKGDFDTSSIVRKLKLKENFNYKQIFFGEHLLQKYPLWPIAIVESEKTAIVASACKAVFPDLVWLASGSKRWLNTERIVRIGRLRKVILFPDGDGFNAWSAIACECRKHDLSVSVSTLIDTLGTPQEKGEGFDLADYLVRDQKMINEHNGHSPSEMAILRAEAQAIIDEGCGLYRGFAEEP